MKAKTTIKYIKNNFKTYYCGYGDLQYIMHGQEANYYNAGVYGWNCDIYINYKHDIAITTGYRNMTGIRIPNEVIDKYSNIAKEILKNTFAKPYDEIKMALYENEENFFDEIANL